MRFRKIFEPSPSPENNNKVVESILKPIPEPNSDVVVEAKKEKEYVPQITFP